MTKEFVTYEQALALKELGFDEPCFAVYYDTKEFKTYTGVWVKFNSEFNGKGVMSAPLYQQAFRWFRDVHELEGVSQKADSFSWFKFCIWKYTSNGKHRVNDAFDFEHKTYEEVESVCLDKLIEICKNK
jgi:hypothetical protein